MKAKNLFFLFFGIAAPGLFLSPAHAQRKPYRQVEWKTMLGSPTLRNETTPAAAENHLTVTGALNSPRPGDSLVKQRLAYTDPGEAGENRLWDFSRLTPEGEDRPVNYFLRPDSSLIGAEDATLHFYALDSTAWLSRGYENPLTFVRYDQPEVRLSFPLPYPMQTAGYYSGRGNYGDRLEMSVAGSSLLEADAFGTLILPGGDTIYQAFRVHHIRQVTEHYFPVTPEFDLNRPSETDVPADSVVFRLEQDSIIRLCDTYQWYARGYRYPILEVVSNYRDVAGKLSAESQFTCLLHPTDQDALPDDPENRQIREQNALKSEVTPIPTVANVSHRVYPNPVENELHIEMEVDTPSQVQVFLYDLQGRLLYQGTSVQTQGHYSETVDMSRMTKGGYLLRVQIGNKSVKELIIKR